MIQDHVDFALSDKSDISVFIPFEYSLWFMRLQAKSLKWSSMMRTRTRMTSWAGANFCFVSVFRVSL